MLATELSPAAQPALDCLYVPLLPMQVSIYSQRFPSSSTNEAQEPPGVLGKAPQLIGRQ